MSKINPKLNLNKVPQIVENNSLIFAKNIKLLKDGSIVRDDGIKKINKLNPLVNSGHDIVGNIPYNTCVYLFFYNPSTGISQIRVYDEKLDTLTKIECGWKYSGGVIDGQVIINHNSDVLLIIGEYKEGTDIPLKIINTSICKSTDDESIYTQAPKIPVTNLSIKDTYSQVIPNGVYQFFVRYEITDDNYTKWFPCSKEIYSGTEHVDITIHGTVKYVDTMSDSSTSFIFGVQHLAENLPNYKNFQIGFILSHDDEVVARSWKKFDLTTNTIYFDYDKSYIEEVDINDMLENTYNLFNVKNITSFKNKIYISNYKETNFNEDYDDLAKKINVEIAAYDLTKAEHWSYNGKEINTVKKQVSRQSENTEIYYSTFVNDEDTFANYIKNKDLYLQKGVVFTRETSEETQAYDSRNTAGDEYNATDKLSRIEIYSVKIRCDNGKIITLFNGTKKYYRTDLGNIAEDIFRGEATGWFNSYIVNEINKYNDNEEKEYDLTTLYFDYDGKLYIPNSGRPIQIDSINVEFYSFFVDSKEGVYSDSDDKWYFRTVEIKGYNTGSKATFSIRKMNTSYLTYHNDNNFGGKPSLIPFKSYKFYVHYVNEFGEITNGYYICEKLITFKYNENYPGDRPIIPNDKLSNYVFYPKFSNLEKPPGYPYCFISITDSNLTVASVFSDNSISSNEGYGHCLDIDTLLIPAFENLTIVEPNELVDYGDNYYNDETGLPTRIEDINGFYNAKKYKYYPSGIADQNHITWFGASGKIDYRIFDSDTEDYFLLLEKSLNENYINLTKCTPFIAEEEYDNRENLNLLGFNCSIYKPYLNDEKQYISGTDVFEKSVDNNQLILKENTEPVNIQPTISHRIFSEYNLNYLSLTDQIYNRIRTTGTGDDKKRQLFKSVESLTLDSIYELKSMYKEFGRKYYSNYSNKNNIFVFDNTIRASETIVDEGRTSNIKFKALDYYNVPVNKGKIVLMKSAGNLIIVHCEDSLFNFSGSQSLISNQGGDVQTNESDPFNTGIIEVEGSDKGYAGIQEKHHAAIMQNFYLFYDRDDNTIFFYGGQGQKLQVVSDPIQNLLNYKKIDDIIFANDFYNDRFLIKILFVDKIEVTLSFNYRTKAFASIHDFTFEESFSTKNKCYFINNNNLFKYNSEEYDYGLLHKITDLYPHIEYKQNKHYRIVDIIFNNQYELVKALNSISWIGHKIINRFKEFNKDNLITHFMAEDIERKSEFIDSILIYSDSASSGYIQFDYTKKEVLLANGNPTDNLGVWSFNQFRNILSDNLDKFLKYTDELADKLNEKYKSRSSNIINRDSKGYITLNGERIKNPKYTIDSDQKSLIYGKYFVVRFMIKEDIDFILENVIFNV